MVDAFILTRQWIDTRQGILLEFWLKADNGPLKIVFKRQHAIFFIREQDISIVQNLLNRLSVVQIKPLKLTTFAMESVAGVYFSSQQHLYRARNLLQKKNIPCFESDIRPAERFLTERFITGPVTVHTDVTTNIIQNPLLTPANYNPSFNIMSVDIETDYTNNALFSIAFVSTNVKCVLMIGVQGNNNTNDVACEKIEYIDCESLLLRRFLEWVRIIDPDVFIGWNVINFDFRLLQDKADELKIPFELGRNNAIPIWRKAPDSQKYFLLIPGRVVLDGIDTLKSATFSFESFSLESVGQELLNRGKLIGSEQNNEQTANRKHDPLYNAKEIQRLFVVDKPALAAYNLEDCQLVWDIFENTDLIKFAIERARLTGLEMDRVGGSVAAFENLYLPRLHRKGFIAPNIGDNPGQPTAPGGYVMNSEPGLYDSVLVLDYKSLYPSIIRTFKVDSYGRIAAKKEPKKDTIPGFDGAIFSKTENILPDIIKQLWHARDHAKEDNNKALSQAIKIIMNSFYGVLGTPGCRLHDSSLTSSITKRSHEIILQTVKLIEREGYAVIYGDTDSVFVALKHPLHNDQAAIIGKNLVERINNYWEKFILENYAIKSYLEMEFETHYVKFFMPTVRGSVKGSKKRYAGSIVDANGKQTIIYKGLEAVRTDWTAFAREFQKRLYERIFNNETYEDYIRDTINELKAGKLDHQLIYRKRLRQALRDYRRNIPPHAQAAIKAEKFFADSDLPSRYKNANWIEYVITHNGPETIECQSSRLDYEHYIEKQLTPIAESIISAIGGSIESILQNQIELF